MLRAKGLSLLCGAAALAVGAVAFTGIAIPTAAKATPQYAQQTGQACGACHTNASGGGKLTAKGEAFKKNKK